MMAAGPKIRDDALQAVRQDFYVEGVPVAQWSRNHGFQPRQVYALLSGRSKGRFGRAHEIAVALGLKPRQPGSRQEPAAPAASTHLDMQAPVTVTADAAADDGTNKTNRPQGCEIK